MINNSLYVCIYREVSDCPSLEVFTRSCEQLIILPCNVSCHSHPCIFKMNSKYIRYIVVTGSNDDVDTKNMGGVMFKKVPFLMN